MVIRSEGGLRNHRTEYIRETTTGTTPSDPSWNFYSDTVRSFEWSPDAQIEEQRGLGDAAPAGFFRGPETHELTITYDLQQAISGTDASDDGLVRDSDQLLKNTHSFVDREDKTSLDAEETVNGSTSHDTRIYTVGKGGHIDEVVITGDPGSQQPVQVELTYQFEKVRTYQIDQPSSSTELALESTDSSDTSLTVTIENEGASTTEDVTLDGSDATTLVSSSSTFSDVDVIELGSESTGDINVYINSGSQSTPAKGDQIATIRGQSTYNSIEGDLGVPALGSSGSHASAIGSSYELFLGDTIERPDGTTTWAYDISSIEFSVSNNLETNIRSDSMRQRIHVGNQDVEVSASLMGETESFSQITEHLEKTSNDIDWVLTNTELRADNAVLMDAPSRTVEAGQASMGLDTSFSSEGVTIDP